MVLSTHRALHLVTLGLIMLWGSCAYQEATEPVSTHTGGWPIFYGTEVPTQTDLWEGEQRAIGFLVDGADEVFCTATLIDPWVAVTAAHCIYNGPDLQEVRFGLGHPASPDVLIAIHQAPIHESLDLALLWLWSDALSIVPEAQPLPFNREPIGVELVGSQVEVAGHGLTHDESQGLRFVVLALTAVEEETLVVNGYGERGLCSGDSGGPLFLPEWGEYPTIAAVESYGDQTCLGEDRLTRLDVAADWIDTELEGFRRETIEPPPGASEAICSHLPLASGSAIQAWILICCSGFLWPAFRRFRMAVAPRR
ncbi:MAG: S1 family peptidase [Bradymonadales bacterium]|nr:S1 family peptidase [Bradymonadales bacterium]